MNFIRLGKREAVVQEESGALESVREVSLARGSWIETDQAIAMCFAIAACLVHFLWNGRYGYFRDELYYAACGQHLAWGYVDQAPLIAVIARLSRTLFGDSLHALRFFPALAAGAKILLTGWIVRELGGRRYAQILAGTAMLLCPIFLTMDNFLSMNAFEPCFGCFAWPSHCGLSGRGINGCGSVRTRRGHRNFEQALHAAFWICIFSFIARNAAARVAA